MVFMGILLSIIASILWSITPILYGLRPRRLIDDYLSNALGALTTALPLSLLIRPSFDLSSLILVFLFTILGPF